MHVGWQGYARFYQTGVLRFSGEAEQVDMLERLKAMNLDPALRKLSAPEINTVLDSRLDMFAPKLLPGETPFQCIARKLADDKSNTSQLLRGLKGAWKRMVAEKTNSR